MWDENVLIIIAWMKMKKWLPGFWQPFLTNKQNQKPWLICMPLFSNAYLIHYIGSLSVFVNNEKHIAYVNAYCFI